MDNNNPKKLCKRCQKEGEFYTFKDGHGSEYCKDCECEMYNLDSFCRRYNIPFSRVIYKRLSEQMKLQGHEVNNRSMFGRYLSYMKLKTHEYFWYADSEEIDRRLEAGYYW